MLTDGALSPSRTPRETRTVSLYFPVLNPIVSFSKIDRDRHELEMMAHRTNGAIAYPGNLFRLGALRNHPLRSANGTFAEFSRESCLNCHIMHVPFGQVRSRDLQPLSNSVIAVRYTGICLQEIGGALPVSDTSAERSRHMRIVPRRDHNNTWTCAPSW